MDQALQYTKSHEWVLIEDHKARIGISEYAQAELGDIVGLRLPEVGDAFNSGDHFADIDAAGGNAELYMPVAGTVSAINEEVLDNPELINEDPIESWLIELDGIEVSEELLSEADYLAFVEAE